MNAVSSITIEELLADPRRKVWDKTLADYRVLRAIFDAMPSDAEGDVDRLCDIVYDVQDSLIEVLRAPDVEAFAMKIDFIRERDLGSMPDEWLDALLADVSYLVGGQPNLDRRIAAYHAVRHEEAIYPRGMSDAVADELGSRRSATFRAVVNAPAETIADVMCKLEVYEVEYQDDDIVPHDDMMSILADLRRLAGKVAA